MPEQHPVEIILLRQAASYLTMPIWITNHAGDLIYYNDPAGDMVGLPFDEMGPMPVDQLQSTFKVSDLEGNPISNDEIPTVKPLITHRPARGKIRFLAFDRVWRDIEVWATPLEAQSGRFVGVLATFWELQD